MLNRILATPSATNTQLADDAARLAAVLPEPGRVVLSCKSANMFVPGLLGAWNAGLTVELLPNVQPGTLDRVDADPDIVAVLHDSAEWQHRSPKARYLPDALAALASFPFPGERPDRPWPSVAVRMTTSGTTERPRFVDKAMAELLEELDVLAQITAPARCVLATVPFSHLYGLLWGALLPLRFGARIVSHEALLPADLAAVIEREHVDLVISTSAHLRAMAVAPMPRGLRVISSGARLPEELHAALIAAHGWQVTDVLGSTETGGIATRDQPGAAWTPLPSVRVSAPDGQLVVESPWSARVALDDQVELRADGRFLHIARGGELIKIAGKRAHAHELEATIRAVPGITDACVIAHGGDAKEARVAAVVCLAPGKTDVRAAIDEAVRRQFDPVFVPRVVRVAAAIPRTDRGKPDMDAIRLLLAPREFPTRRVAPGQFVADVPADLVFFRGHFEGHPVLPGAVLVERLVWPLVRAELQVTRLLGMRRLRFNKPVRPAQQLAITIARTAERVTFEVSCGDVVASGTLLVS